MKTKGELLGINEELSTYGRPVFEKDLEPGIVAEANMDRTTFVDKDATDKEKKLAVQHEDLPHDQVQRNELGYDDNYVYWKGKRIRRGSNGNLADGTKEGDHNLPWEKEVYDEQKKSPIAQTEDKDKNKKKNKDSKKKEKKKKQPVFNATDYSNWRSMQMFDARAQGKSSQDIDLSKEAYMNTLKQNK